MSSYRVPFMVGAKKTRDHQMWPTISRDALIANGVANGIPENDVKRAIDRAYPASVNRDQLMKMAWRVREWKVASSDFSYSGFANAVVDSHRWSITASLPDLALKMKRLKVPFDIDDPFRDVRDERDILGPSSDAPFGDPEPWKTLRNVGVLGFADPDDIEVSGISDGGLINPGHSPPDTNSGAFNGGIFGSYVIYDPDSHLFFPPISLGGNFEVVNPNIGTGQTAGVQADFYTMAVPPSAAADSFPSHGGTEGDVQQGTLTIQGIGADIVVPIGMFGRSAGSSPPPWVQGGNGSLTATMTPLSWWPYRNRLGQPVLDENDGHRVNNP